MRSRLIRRALSSDSGQTLVFDRQLFLRHRGTALGLVDSPYYDYLRTEVANRVVDRLDDITRGFPRALDLGCHRGHILKALVDKEGIGQIETLIHSDISAEAVSAAAASAQEISRSHPSIKTSFLVTDEESELTEEEQFDLVMSSLYLHWVGRRVVWQMYGSLYPIAIGERSSWSSAQNQARSEAGWGLHRSDDRGQLPV